MDTTHDPLDSRVHAALLRELLARNHAQSPDELAARLDAPRADIDDSLRRLEANHSLILHPGSLDVWMVHPASTTPTLFYVTDGEVGTWAPCIWCALGVAWLRGGELSIHTTLGAQTEQCVLRFCDGVLEPADLLAHLPVPVANAWDNVHKHCALTLVFRDEAAIDRWCAEHDTPRGEVLTLEALSDFARTWYGRHLDEDWRKPTAQEAAALFTDAGLTSAHWHVPGGDERF
jgi:hypothetical protein